MLAHVAPIVAARQKAIQLIDEQDGRAVLAGPGEYLLKPFDSRNIGGRDQVEAAARLSGNQVHHRRFPGTVGTGTGGVKTFG